MQEQEQKAGVVTFSHAGDSRNFAPGDIISSGQMVLRVDHDNGTVTIGKATWWRRARVWLRARWIDGWRWARCTLADGWARVTGREP